MSTKSDNIYLSIPPPTPCVHVKVNPDCMISVRVVTLWGENEHTRELWIAVKSPDALDYIAIVDLKCFTSYDDLTTYESRPPRGELVVDNRVQFTRVLEG